MEQDNTQNDDFLDPIFCRVRILEGFTVCAYVILKMACAIIQDSTATCTIMFNIEGLHKCFLP